ncbi:hypothetical protein Tsubulata_012050 [Turnera subulata]|uniref:Uncharacterized protein n=1 Tax=Turnera subulata TaxID=218843 RepID=A0A9Q0JPY3_9ROSI|nr:hypothetical protein Tsubulata_012050 [Turnera subulata]
MTKTASRHLELLQHFFFLLYIIIFVLNTVEVGPRKIPTDYSVSLSVIYTAAEDGTVMASEVVIKVLNDAVSLHVLE